MSQTDPAQELASLSRALSREIGRRRWHGQRAESQGVTPQRELPKNMAPIAAQVPEPVVLPPSSPDPESDTRQAAQRATNMRELADAVTQCQACDLCRSRKATVFARGDGSASVAFLTLAPGALEETSGSPLAGPPGDLLDKIITSGMKLDPQKTALFSLVKCRPPQDRAPSNGEIRTCAPFLERQIQLTKPRVLIPLGEPCAQAFLGPDPQGRALQGRIHRPGGPAVLPIHHPQELLQDPSSKADCWGLIQAVMTEMGLPPQS